MQESFKHVRVEGFRGARFFQDAVVRRLHCQDERRKVWNMSEVQSRRKPFIQFTFDWTRDWIVDGLPRVASKLPSLMLYLLPYVVIASAWFVSCSTVVLMNMFWMTVLVQVTCFITSKYLKYSEVEDTGFPVPPKRFTSESRDGEVSIENSRLQEMIIYVCDVEDWLESSGFDLSDSDGPR